MPYMLNSVLVQILLFFATSNIYCQTFEDNISNSWRDDADTTIVVRSADDVNFQIEVIFWLNHVISVPCRANDFSITTIKEPDNYTTKLSTYYYQFWMHDPIIHNHKVHYYIVEVRRLRSETSLIDSSYIYDSFVFVLNKKMRPLYMVKLNNFIQREFLNVRDFKYLDFQVEGAVLSIDPVIGHKASQNLHWINDKCVLDLVPLNPKKHISVVSAMYLPFSYYIENCPCQAKGEKIVRANSQ